MRDEIDVMLELHDGDDRCGCLAEAVQIALDWTGPDDREIAVAAINHSLRECLANHPAGTTWRRRMINDLTSEPDSE